MLVFLEGKINGREFYLQDTVTVARELLGCCIAVLKSPVSLADTQSGHIALAESNAIVCGRITETEAYLGLGDKACHSYKANPEGRTNIMYGVGGYAYIYLVYGIYHCFNAVTRERGIPEAVLVRAMEAGGGDKKKFSGPGKLCREAGVTRADYGADLCAEKPSRIVIIKPDNYIKPEIAEAKRIGIAYSGEAADYLYRFYDKNSQSVSKR